MVRTAFNRVGALAAIALMLCSVFAVAPGAVAAQESAANESVTIDSDEFELTNESGQAVAIAHEISADADVTKSMSLTATDANGTEVINQSMGSPPVTSGEPTTGDAYINADQIDSPGDYTVTLQYGEASDSANLTVVEPVESPGGGGVLPDDGGIDPVVIGLVLVMVALLVAAFVID